MTTKIKGRKIRVKALPVLKAKATATDPSYELDCDDDGYWAYCKPGWWNADAESHTFHEDTRRALDAAIKSGLKPCGCEGCKKDLAKAAFALTP